MVQRTADYNNNNNNNNNNNAHSDSSSLEYHVPEKSNKKGTTWYCKYRNDKDGNEGHDE
eukprot:CAMPEP_0118697668 /NCGR_PEP_ID=MMETSP0800-20121206/14674_1 /TAXON_ID=210618 ORGANISM="Striatella unipunctata, Strain CCMP2910" /NCGR_SAMPLE_ID=MMETSP0800 /ASSEMBLY_ACC=CAM_ASM_000638 /LENGTH=58 /DNA_ID=CAMNT_0006597205 /DNA_START=402 /DNA_END=578 /DNA_ORIENTATION=-